MAAAFVLPVVFGLGLPGLVFHDYAAPPGGTTGDTYEIVEEYSISCDGICPNDPTKLPSIYNNIKSCVTKEGEGGFAPLNALRKMQVLLHLYAALLECVASIVPGSGFILGGMAEGLRTVSGTIGTSVEEIARAFQYVFALPGKVANAILAAFDNIAEAATKPLDAVVGGFEQIWNSVKNPIEDFAEFLRSAEETIREATTPQNNG